MNCREFDELSQEIARDAVLDPAARREALEHVAECLACEQRLEDDRALAAALRALGAADAALAPSAFSAASLLAAYRVERRSEVRSRRWMILVAGAMAASVLLLLGATLGIWRDSIPLISPASRSFPPLAAHPEASGRTASSVSPSGSEISLGAKGSAPAAGEEVTDFVAFYPGSDLEPFDSGALVRVRVQGSALGAFGLPVAEGSEEQWFNADLLVAEDGSPRAIRFVRSVQ